MHSLGVEFGACGLQQVGDGDGIPVGDLDQVGQSRSVLIELVLLARLARGRGGVRCGCDAVAEHRLEDVHDVP